jgi:hypothetical protein
VCRDDDDDEEEEEEEEEGGGGEEDEDLFRECSTVTCWCVEMYSVCAWMLYRDCARTIIPCSRNCQKDDVLYFETCRSRANKGEKSLDMAECWMEWEPSVAGRVLRSCASLP